jgi:ribokinase
MVGQVGDDDFGQTLRLGLQAAGVNVEAVTINPDVHSGVASIVVGNTGENAIACAAGANHQVGQKEIENFTALAENAKVVLLELGVPIEAVIAAARAAQAHNCTVILDPAPAIADFPEELYSFVDILTPNEVEATQLVGFPVDSPATAQKAALVLQARGIPTVIVTLGEQGALCCTAEETFLVPAIPTEVVDTVAAGDAFNGALAAALASGESLKEALHWGTVAGSLSVKKKGAQPSLPTRAEFDAARYSSKRSTQTD